MKKMICILLCMLFLTGCKGRELEERRFPTVFVADTGDFRRQEEERQKNSAKYIDYGHVKAVIFSEDAIRDAKQLQSALAYLEHDFLFARSILVFVGDESVCEKAREEEEKVGVYLEGLAENQPQGGMEKLPLKDLLNYLHNKEPSIRIPMLSMDEREILPAGTIEITQEAAVPACVPIPRRAKEKGE